MTATERPRLAGKRALVTGASRGIGRAIALQLAAEGAAVAVHHLDDEADAASVVAEANALAPAGSSRPGIVVRADITRQDEVEEMVAEVVAKLGGVDLLVNNAGFGDRAAFFEITPELWTRTIDVNLGGTFRVSQAAARAMVETGGGSIVNVSSVSSFIGSPDQVHYCASKAGINGLTIALAVALGPSAVRVNAVLPAGVPTEMNRPADVPPEEWGQVAASLRPGSPVDRFGTPADIAKAVCFLASDDASWVTGVTLPVDGGYGVMPRAVRNLRSLLAADLGGESRD